MCLQSTLIIKKKKLCYIFILILININKSNPLNSSIDPHVGADAQHMKHLAGYRAWAFISQTQIPNSGQKGKTVKYVRAYLAEAEEAEEIGVRE